MNVTWQLAFDPLPESVQPTEENRPGLLLENVTVPVGVIVVPGLASVTMTVQVVRVLRAKGLEHDRATETLRSTMLRSA